MRPAGALTPLGGRLSFLVSPKDALFIPLKLLASHPGDTPFGCRPFNVDANVTGSDPLLGWFKNASLNNIEIRINKTKDSHKIDCRITEHPTRV